MAAKLGFLADRLEGDYLAGGRPSVPDFYLFVMLLWAGKFGVAVPDRLDAYRDRLMGRESVRKAMQHERLI